MLKPEETALLIVDVQKKFCEPWILRGTDKTDVIAKKIGKLAPAFRKAGVQIYAVRVEQTGSPFEKIDDYDFHHFRPSVKDIVVTKRNGSAFDGTDMDAFLKKTGKKNVLVWGFNLCACVYSTAVDGAKNGYNVSVIEDLSGNDRICYQDGGLICNFLKRLEDQGVAVTSAKKTFQGLHRARKK